MDVDQDLMLFLGSSDKLTADWDAGTFRDNFWGTWGAIDGNLVYMELTAANDQYSLYAVPVLLNDEEYTLSVAYDPKTEAYTILGARKGLDESGMSDKELRQLQVGDTITTLHYGTSISGDDDTVQVLVDTFTVTADTAFTEVDMGDGDFVLLFAMTDTQNNDYLSQGVYYQVENGEIYSYVGD